MLKFYFPVLKGKHSNAFIFTPSITIWLKCLLDNTPAFSKIENYFIILLTDPTDLGFLPEKRVWTKLFFFNICSKHVNTKFVDVFVVLC